MTLHALERIAERFPDLDPARTVARLRAAHDPDSAWTRPAEGGRTISRVCIGPHVLFPIYAKDGELVTVLKPGMLAPGEKEGGKVLEPGLGKGIYRLPPQDYHADPAPAASFSSTIARTMLTKSPRHAWADHPRLNPNPPPKKDTEAFDVGRAAHRRVLGRGEAYVRIPERLLSADGGVRSKDAKEWVEDARAKGQTPLKPEVVDEVDAMAEAFLTRLEAMGITFEAEHSELAAIAEVDGIWCRAMVDNAKPGRRQPLFDLKTTTDASLEAIEHAIRTYGYDVQAAHYVDTWEAATGERRPFIFGFIEKKYPYEACVIEITGAGMEMAQRQAKRARYLWHQHMRMNVWPGYPATVHRLELPEWYLAKTMAREDMQEKLATAPTRETLERAHQWQSPEGTQE